MKLSDHQIYAFQAFIWQYYHECGRSFAWRQTYDPYHILVSEIMLQQTQTHRVVQKYEEWLAVFPHIENLAQASLRDVLSVWQGLGYNRRGKYLHQIAQLVVNEYQSVIPNDPLVLATFPGLGPATASSICAFAYNLPTVFIETNIRSVFIHSFFKDKETVNDKEILPLIAQTVDVKNAREWYYALMDYGVKLKKDMPNPNRKSIHYARQSKFEGSDRQIRGQIIRLLTECSPVSYEKMIEMLKVDPLRAQKITEQLCKEGMVIFQNDTFQIDV